MTLDPDTPWWARLILSRAIFPLLMIAGALVWALISPIIQAIRVSRLRREQELSVPDDKDGPTGVRLQ